MKCVGFGKRAADRIDLNLQVATLCLNVALYKTFVNNAQTATPGGRTGSHQYTMSSSIMQGNRLGFRGTEELGGGYQAIFVLENDFEIGTGALGQGGNLFGRQAYVGVASPYGTVTIGRQYDSGVDYIGPITGVVGNGTFALLGNDINNFGNTYRVNNAVKFTSNTYSGFKFGGLYSAGGVAGSFGTNSIYSAGASHSNGPFTGAVAYLRARDPNHSFFGNNPKSSATANNLGATSGVQTNRCMAPWHRQPITRSWAPRFNMRYRASLSVSTIRTSRSAI
ncbi:MULTISPECIES: porin [Burkholderia cepacia complex]|uniref:porin n=1 Tax=Burkholderia cepacia complex TaxID=87882 RepID=UPI001CF238D5|nr:MULTISPECIES: porin [Burkholderia cepacia complex]MCA8057357.1 porin [Burkholderia cepacia]MDN7535182.1 porin [Burkholderia orbicola]